MLRLLSLFGVILASQPAGLPRHVPISRSRGNDLRESIAAKYRDISIDVHGASDSLVAPSEFYKSTEKIGSFDLNGKPQGDLALVFFGRAIDLFRAAADISSRVDEYADNIPLHKKIQGMLIEMKTLGRLLEGADLNVPELEADQISTLFESHLKLLNSAKNAISSLCEIC